MDDFQEYIVEKGLAKHILLPGMFLMRNLVGFIKIVAQIFTLRIMRALDCLFSRA